MISMYLKITDVTFLSLYLRTRCTASLWEELLIRSRWSWRPASSCQPQCSRLWCLCARRRECARTAAPPRSDGKTCRSKRRYRDVRRHRTEENDVQRRNSGGEKRVQPECQLFGQRSSLCDEVEQILALRRALQHQQEAPPLHLKPVQHADDPAVTSDLRQSLQQGDLHGNATDITGLRKNSQVWTHRRFTHKLNYLYNVTPDLMTFYCN